MEITICNNNQTRIEKKRVCDGYADLGDGKITLEDWADEDRFPRKQWLDVEVNPQTDVASFIVVDNRSGDCFVESFDTLDGAMLYLCDIHTTCSGQHEWDYPGAVKERGSLDIVIKRPIALNSAEEEEK